MNMMGKFKRYLMDNLLKNKTILLLSRSLKDVDDFIIRVGNEIYDLTRRKKLMDKIKEKELQQH